MGLGGCLGGYLGGWEGRLGLWGAGARRGGGREREPGQAADAGWEAGDAAKAG